MSVVGIEIKIGDKHLLLTRQEAKQLYHDLESLFGNRTILPSPQPAEPRPWRAQPNTVSYQRELDTKWEAAEAGKLGVAQQCTCSDCSCTSNIEGPS